MRYCFQLANLLQHKPDPRKRPGTIKQVCEYTGLDRHQVAALLKNEVKYIPLEAIGKLCDYLIHRGICMPHELPGKLFALEPEDIHLVSPVSQAGSDWRSTKRLFFP